MTITTTTTAAAARPRTLSTQASPSTLPVRVDSWRERMPVVGVPTYMRTKSAFRSVHLEHNSIVSTADAALVRTGNGVLGAAKQAAPPREVPR